MGVAVGEVMVVGVVMVETDIVSDKNLNSSHSHSHSHCTYKVMSSACMLNIHALDITDPRHNLPK